MTNVDFVLDIGEVFNQLYGYIPPHINSLPPQSEATNPYTINNQKTKQTSTIKGSKLYGLADTLGREVFCPVTIKAGKKSYDFPYMIIGLRSRMILKETPMVERGGSVIEEIGAGPWELNCRGFLIDPYNNFPDQQLADLNSLYKYREPINILCPLTDLFLESGDQVVISDLEIPPKPKVIGVRDFAFTLIQDSILDLYKIE